MPLTDDEIEAVTALHDAFGLTCKEALILMMLSRGGIIAHTRICGIYCDNPNTNPIEARSCIKRIRAKLRAFPSWQVIIISHYGMGYELTPESMKTVRAIIRGKAFFRPSFTPTLPSTRETAAP